uniref:Uncharacterized protein n=1 Tax=Cryptomonas curvata TaxID=233186 RepID=A0A6T7ZSK3_9CRYP|mmetsp:Transcript_41091/g.85794  ORF Transcript_41091/g.85794 Transcript_41091/m.85794 type:complete len:205 (+) Transcript_41091:1858-2472(+)
MSLLHVSPRTSVRTIVDSTFPAIKAMKDKPTPVVTSKTVGYIHALLIDTLTFHSTDPIYARAIANAEVIRGELDGLTPEAFRAELSACLLDYYEKVCGMAGISGDKPVLKRKFGASPAAAAVAAENDAAGAASQHAAEDAEDLEAAPADALAGAPADAPADAQADAPADADADAAPSSKASPAKPKQKGSGGGGAAATKNKRRP